MNVAEDERNSRAVEMDASASAAFVKTEVELSAIKERKDIMEKGIAVREVNYAAYWNDQKMGLKLLVLLDKLKVDVRI
jgi:hypothetical protein